MVAPPRPFSPGVPSLPPYASPGTVAQYQAAVKVPGCLYPPAGRPHFHGHFSFAERSAETAPGSLRHWRMVRDLPAKALRYFRSVMCTLVLHRGFGSEPYIRRPPPLGPGSGQTSAPIRQLSLWQGPVVFVTSRPGLFSAAPSSSSGARLHPKGQPISRSYGLNLPSSLAESRSLALGHSSSPTGVGLRYGRLPPSPRGFFLAGSLIELPHHLSASRLPILRIRNIVSSVWGHPHQRGFRPPWALPSSYPSDLPPFSCRFGRGISNAALDLSPRVAPWLIAGDSRCRSINRLSIAYGRSPRLRPD